MENNYDSTDISNDGIQFNFENFDFGATQNVEKTNNDNKVIESSSEDKKASEKVDDVNLEKDKEQEDQKTQNDGIDFNKADTKQDSNSESTNANQIDVSKEYFKFLKEHNLIVTEDEFEFDGTDEGLEQAHSQTIQAYQRSALNAILEKLPTNLQDMAIYALKGGTDFEAFNNKTTSSLDDSTLDGQTQIVKDYYKNIVKWPTDKIERYLSKLSEQDVQEEATDAKTKLIEEEATIRENYIKAQEAKEAEKLASIKEFNTKIESNIEQAGFVPAPRKQKLKNFIFNNVRKEDGPMTEMIRTFNTIQKNPEHFIQLADLLMDYDPKTGIAYTRFEKKSTTTINNGLKKALEQTVGNKIAAMSGYHSTGSTDNKNPIDWSKFQL